MQERSTALATSMRETREWVHANVLNRAFTSTYTMGTNHDGQELCDSAHPAGPYGGTYSNLVSADLSEAALETALILADGFVDARGLKVKVSGQKLIVPPASRFEAERLMATTMQPGTANNDVNALKDTGMLRQYSVNIYLSDPDAWFIKTDAEDGLKHFVRRKLKKGMEGDFETGNMRYKCSERGSFGWTDPRGFFATPGL